MSNLTRKLFSLGDLRYGLLLLLSVGICSVTYYIDEHINPMDQLWLSISYYVSFTIAALWSVANYVGHIRMNNMYSKQHDIRAYVDQLALSREDKLELFNYLEDYAADLKQQGMSEERASKEAIDQFRVREFLSMSKHAKPFESHEHHYLLGYSILSLIMAVVCAAIGILETPLSLYMMIAETVLFVYGVCLGLLYVFYKVLDRVIYERLRKYFSS